MIPTKYPKSNHNEGHYGMEWKAGEQFSTGDAWRHACYLVEMKASHPIMYFLWFRWWIPTLLHEDEREKLDHYVKVCSQTTYRSFWAEFSMHHPVQFLLYYLAVFLFQRLIKFLTAPVKMINRTVKPQSTKNGFGDVLIEDKLVK